MQREVSVLPFPSAAYGIRAHSRAVQANLWSTLVILHRLRSRTVSGRSLVDFTFSPASRFHPFLDFLIFITNIYPPFLLPAFPHPPPFFQSFSLTPARLQNMAAVVAARHPSPTSYMSRHPAQVVNRPISTSTTTPQPTSRRRPVRPPSFLALVPFLTLALFLSTGRLLRP